MTASAFPALVPVLAVDDIPDEISFYRSLGFTELEGSTFLDADGRPVHATSKRTGACSSSASQMALLTTPAIYVRIS